MSDEGVGIKLRKAGSLRKFREKNMTLFCKGKVKESGKTIAARIRQNSTSVPWNSIGPMFMEISHKADIVAFAYSPKISKMQFRRTGKAKDA